MGRRRTNTGIPGLSFSWKRALGVSRVRYRIARATGMPTTRGGRQRKLGRACGLLLIPLAIPLHLLGLL